MSRSQQQVPAERLGAVFVRSVLTPAGRPRYDLYGRAEAMGKTALVAASSYRGDARRAVFADRRSSFGRHAGGVPGSPTVRWVGRDFHPVVWAGTVASGIAVAVQQKTCRRSHEPSFADIEALLGGAVGSAFPSASLSFGQSSQPNTIAVGDASLELGLTSRH